MRLNPLSPSKALSKAYLKQSVKREQIELFRANLARLLDKVNEKESEEHLKNLVSDFLKDTWYKNSFEINTKDRADLVIHNGVSAAETVGVLVEVKRPSNKNEMISADRPNAKALHELLHYFMQERYIQNNKEIRHLVICNIYEWYIFDAVEFEKFFSNPKLVKSYRDWNDGTLSGTDTDWFYKEIAKPFIEENLTELPCTNFDLKDFERMARNPAKTDDKKLIALYKVLSPQHLLKQTFTNDSNSLNRGFYNELLHILGLEEIKDKGKKLIRRKAEGNRHEGSLLENTFDFLKNRNRLSAIANPQQYGGTEEEQLFSIALELCITWLNRLLFLKLLEGQLIAYHRGNRDYAFLNSSRIEDFDELNELFFDVLAVRIEDRTASVRTKFGDVPYLNSSLFEESDLERATLRINELKNRHDLPLYPATVLKDASGKRIGGARKPLQYLFEFLEAYDFGAEGGEIREGNKSIINAAVLGLIFEKINGYRDGSFFTPGFITMYICRETIRRSVLQKFNERYGWGCGDFTGLYNTLDKIGIQEANVVVNSIRICDPAVGSGHFLVSALNEIIAIKAELGILADSDGKRLRGHNVTIENDELIIVSDDQIFEYNFRDPESQRVQETLFHEKEAIIENCLFGVDINPKSVAICRLRLWIELLKSAYYRPLPTNGQEMRQLETLPNIDINIKCGNSLVSRFALSGSDNVLPADRKKLKELTERYRRHVFEYKLSPANKAQLRKVIDGLKEDLQNFGLPNDKDLVALRKKKNELAQLSLFAYDKKESETRQRLYEDVEKLERKFDEKQKSIYANAFEWRFEFPEVLDENGEFVGFDVVIGNPPYIRQEAIKDQKPALTEMFGNFFCGTADIYTYFYKTGLDVAKPGATLCYIAPNKFMRAGYGKNTRELLTSQAKPLMVLDFGDLPIFEEATTYPSIVMVEKMPFGDASGPRPIKKAISESDQQGQFLTATFTDPDQLARFGEVLPSISFNMQVSALKPEGWTLERPEVLELMEKLRNAGKPLGEYVEGKFYYGIKTGLNEAFVIDEETRQRLIAEDPKSAEIIKPWLRGRDIRKWKAQWAKLYVLYIPWHFDISDYPAIKKHLLNFRDQLENRNLSERGRYEWYALQRYAADYFQEFEKQKIVYQEIATYQSFGYSEPGTFCNNKCFIIPRTDDFLLAIVNCKLSWWFLGNLTSSLAGGARAMQTPYMEQLPIPCATDAQKNPIIKLVQRILTDSDSHDVTQLEAEIDRLVYEMYGLSEAEIVVVEG
jgi:adenine-specific DNA-methyltransferase